MFEEMLYLPKPPSLPSDKGAEIVATQTGQHVNFRVNNIHSLCKEFVLSHRPFSLRRWLILSVFFNSVGFCFNLHLQDSRLMTVLLVIVLVSLIIKINIKVHEESLLVSSAAGVQLTTTFMSGRKKSMFYDRAEVQDILINEGITMHQVLFYLTLVLKNRHEDGISKLVPLFTHCWPSVTCLRQIFQGSQMILMKKANMNISTEAGT